MMTGHAPVSDKVLTSFLSSAEAGDYRRGLFPGILDVASLERPMNSPNLQVLYSDGALQAIGKMTALEWDSDFFGTPSGRIESFYFQDSSISPYADRLSMVKKLVAIAERQGVSFLNCRITAEDTFLAHALEEEGFRLCDILNIYLAELGDEAVSGPDNRQEAKSILGRCVANMNFGRVHQDPMITSLLATKFYQDTTDWVLSKNCHVTIARLDGKPAGLAIGVMDEEMSKAMDSRYGFLWLIAVMPEYEGRGIGGKLLKAFMGEFSAACDLLEIGTQVSNISANRLYRRAGCRLATQALTFHRWS